MLRSRLLLLVALISLMAACGSDDRADPGSVLVAPPTRTPAPAASATPLQAPDATPVPAAPALIAVETRLGRGAAADVAWSAEGSALLISSTTGLWRYPFAYPGAGEALPAPWTGTAQLSPDGRYAIARDAAGVPTLWALDSGAAIVALGSADERLLAPTFSAAGDALAVAVAPITAGGSGVLSGGAPLAGVTAIRVWALDLRTATDYALPDARLLGMTFASDGRLLIATSADNLTTALSSGPDGQVLASGPTSSDTRIRVWDARSGEPISAIADLEHPAESVTFSPDGAWIAAQAVIPMSYDNLRWALRVWESASGTPLATPDLDSASLIRVHSFSPDGSRLAVGLGSRDSDLENRAFTQEAIAIVNLTTGETEAMLQSEALLTAREGTLATNYVSPEGALAALRFSPDGSRLAALTIDSQVIAWDLRAPGAPVTIGDFNSAITQVALSADGQVSLAASTHGLLRTWPVAELRGPGRVIGGTGFTVHWLVAPTSDVVLSKEGSNLSRIVFWDLPTGAIRTTLNTRYRPMSISAVSPDAAWVATSGGGATISLWRVAETAVDGAIVAEHQITCLAFSPDGAWLAAGGMDGTISLWDTATRTPITTLRGHTGAITQLAFSADSATLISASVLDSAQALLPLADGMPGVTGADYTVRRWDLASGSALSTIALADPGPGGYYATSLSADGSRLGLIDAQDGALVVSVWDTATGGLLATWPAAEPWLTGLALGPRGEQVLAGRIDGTVSLWELRAP